MFLSAKINSIIIIIDFWINTQFLEVTRGPIKSGYSKQRGAIKNANRHQLSPPYIPFFGGFGRWFSGLIVFTHHSLDGFVFNGVGEFGILQLSPFTSIISDSYSWRVLSFSIVSGGATVTATATSFMVIGNGMRHIWCGASLPSGMFLSDT